MGDASVVGNQMAERLFGFLIALAVGVIVALVGYFLNLSAMRKERKEKSKEQLNSAMHGILVELETNLKLARQPFAGRLVPFATEMWDSHKGGILELSQDSQTLVHQTYIAVQQANALVQNDLQLEYGRGYYNKPYQDICKEIVSDAEKTVELLRSWLKQSDTRKAKQRDRLC